MTLPAVHVSSDVTARIHEWVTQEMGPQSDHYLVERHEIVYSKVSIRAAPSNLDYFGIQHVYSRIVSYLRLPCLSSESGLSRQLRRKDLVFADRPP